MRIMFKPWCRDKETNGVWHRVRHLRRKTITSVDREYWGDDGGPDFLMMVCGKLIVDYNAKGGLKPGGRQICKICQQTTKEASFKKYPTHAKFELAIAEKQNMIWRRRLAIEHSRKKQEERWIGGRS